MSELLRIVAIGANRPIAFPGGFGLRRDNKATVLAQSHSNNPARIWGSNESCEAAYEVTIDSKSKLPAIPQFPHRDSKWGNFPSVVKNIAIWPDTFDGLDAMIGSKMDWWGARNGFRIDTTSEDERMKEDEKRPPGNPVTSICNDSVVSAALDKAIPSACDVDLATRAIFFPMNAMISPLLRIASCRFKWMPKIPT